MRVFKSQEECTVGSAPVGLFLIKSCDEIICITEYRRNNGNRDAYIVSSGEAFCGEGDETVGWPIIVN